MLKFLNKLWLGVRDTLNVYRFVRVAIYEREIKKYLDNPKRYFDIRVAREGTIEDKNALLMVGVNLAKFLSQETYFNRPLGSCYREWDIAEFAYDNKDLTDISVFIEYMDTWFIDKSTVDIKEHMTSNLDIVVEYIGVESTEWLFNKLRSITRGYLLPTEKDELLYLSASHYVRRQYRHLKQPTTDEADGLTARVACRHDGIVVRFFHNSPWVTDRDMGIVVAIPCSEPYRSEYENLRG